MPELSTAWISIAVSGRGLKQDITKALNEAERGAKINPKIDSAKLSREGATAGRGFGSRFSASAKLDPKVNTSGLASQGEKAGKEFGSRFSASTKTALAAVGLAGGIAGLASQFKQVMSVGMDWTNNMNTLTAVTGATADQLKQAGAAARALGNDISLPSTSANDAASAMTELAKGGFTVQQSMDAAKGSLQLAAAAQISATDAATIQSQALQSFGLNASGAGKMADTLANAANASSAEITDVAQALAQAGTVANQFGVSAEDTAAAIGLLANNGIKGSDAGTLLKSSLLALTDQGNPAQGAIKELGLTVYDATGKFVGLHSLYGQLGEAAKRMTPEQYQAATAVLFGSDAMRIAGVAAKDGSVSYDNMRKSIDKQGAAADVAAAKTKGLPGAWERFKNTIESLQLQTYDKLEGPLTKLIDGVAKVPEKLSELAKNPQVQSMIERTKTAFGSLGDSVKGAAPALAQIAKSLGSAAVAIGGAAWKTFVTTLESVAAVVRTITPALKLIGDLMSAHQGLVTSAAAAWLAFKLVPGIMGRVTPALTTVNAAVSSMGKTVGAAGGGVKNLVDAYRTSVQWMKQANPTVSTAGRALFGMGSQAQSASAHLRVLGSNMGSAASGGFSALKGAAGGIVGALGGPFSAALVAGGAAFTLWSAQVQKGEQRARDYAESLRLSARAQREVYEELAKSRGSTNESVFTGLSKQVDEFRNQVNSLRTGPDLLDWLGARGTRGTEAFGMQDRAEQWQVTSDAMDKLNMSSQQLGIALAGDASWEALQRNIRATTDNSGDLIGKFAEIRKEFLDSQSASQALAPAFTTVKDAIATIADAASSAEDKTSAFKSALDALAGIQPSVQEATDRYNTTIRQTAQAAAEVADASKGMGQQLIGADGSVNTATENGHALFEALKNIRTATEGVAGSGGDLKSALAQNDQQLGSLANKFGLTKQQIDAMSAAMGYVPSTIETLFEMRGADDATKQLGLVQELLKQVPPNTPIQVDADSVNKAREDLIKMGAKLEEVDVNGHKQLRITAPNAQVLSDIQAVIDRVKQVPSTFRIDAKLRTPDFVPAVPGETQRPRGGGRADGAIVPFGAIMPMADGGYRWIEKPQTAGLYSGRGAGTVFAEQETGGEAYIPLAQSKRSRSMAILMEVARLFGLGRNAEGSITVDDLKSYASGISGGSYVRGGPAGLTGTDCSGGQAAIANYITGANGRFSTGNESQALLARGFQQGDPPSGIAAYWVGWKNGGPGGGHTAGTIMDPEGGNVNVEMGGKSGGGAFGGGAAGASEFPNRAWIPLAGYGEDPTKSGGTSAAVKSASASVTSAKASVSAAQNTLDKANADLDKLKTEGASADKQSAAEKKRDVAEQRLTAAQERQSAAETRLSEVKDKQASKAEKDGDSGGKDFGQQLASGLFGGVMETLGLPGFADLLDSPNFKSGKALLNAFAGPLKGAMEGKLGIQQPGWSPGMPIGEEGNVVGLPGGGGGGLPGITLPGAGDFLKPLPEAGTQVRPNEPHGGTGAAPGAPITYNMNGVDPKAGLQKADAHANQSYRSSGLPAVRPS